MAKIMEIVAKETRSKPKLFQESGGNIVTGAGRRVSDLVQLLWKIEVTWWKMKNRTKNTIYLPLEECNISR